MKYFTINELCKSSTALEKKIDNSPSKEIIHNLTLLVDKILDPLRENYGKAIHVNSGYRCPALNEAVGGSKTSQHMKGMAADITGGSTAKNKELFNLIIKLDLPFDQLIDEKNFRWVHVSYSPKHRKQILHL
jgi:uncharacterized protein YcbK (DUF882 family)